MIIDPHNITKYDRTEHQLQYFAIFCTLVCGKKATMQAEKQAMMFGAMKGGESPFDYVKRINLDKELRKVKMGQYGRIISAINGLLNLKKSLKKVTIKDFEEINGIGQKTSRFFLVHSRKNVKHAILDTHILRYLSIEFSNIKIPKNTPSCGKKYALLEKLFLARCETLGKKPSELDLEIWSAYSKGEELKIG